MNEAHKKAMKKDSEENDSDDNEVQKNFRITKKSNHSANIKEKHISLTNSSPGNITYRINPQAKRIPVKINDERSYPVHYSETAAPQLVRSVTRVRPVMYSQRFDGNARRLPPVVYPGFRPRVIRPVRRVYPYNSQIIRHDSKIYRPSTSIHYEVPNTSTVYIRHPVSVNRNLSRTPIFINNQKSDIPEIGLYKIHDNNQKYFNSFNNTIDMVENPDNGIMYEEQVEPIEQDHATSICTDQEYHTDDDKNQVIMRDNGADY